jgi:cytolysin (calcineurin-like family phosphatase)
MDNYGNTARSTLAGAPSVADTMRAFPDFSNRVSVAQEAAHAASKELFELMSRLGVSNNYGAACGKERDELVICGDVDALTRQIDQLTDAVRDIRGLSETLNSRL